MRVRTSRWMHREEVKEDANRHNIRSAMHPQVARQLDEADAQEADVPHLTIDPPAAPEPDEFCTVCDKWLNFDEYGDDMCTACSSLVDSYTSSCFECGRSTDDSGYCGYCSFVADGDWDDRERPYI